jgi:hypothetical protein
MPRDRSFRLLRLRAFAAALLVAASVPGPSSASPHPGDDVAAVDAYVEALPSAAGLVTPSGTEAPAQLAPALVARIEREGGGDAARLKEVATSPRFGAPSSVPAVRTVAVPRAAGFGAAVGRTAADHPRELAIALAGVALAAALMAHARTRPRETA